MKKPINHSIKITRAQNLARIGNYPASFNAMLRHVPHPVIDQCSARIVSEILDALWVACQDAKAIAESEACDAGYVWDQRNKQMRDLSPANLSS